MKAVGEPKVRSFFLVLEVYKSRRSIGGLQVQMLRDPGIYEKWSRCIIDIAIFLHLAWKVTRYELILWGRLGQRFGGFPG